MSVGMHAARDIALPRRSTSVQDLGLGGHGRIAGNFR